MKHFLYKILCLALMPILLLSACQRPTREAKLSEVAQAQLADDAEMMAHFKEMTKAQESLPMELSPEFKAMNLALDASAHEQVEAIFAQMEPDKPMNSNKSPKMDSLGLDSLLSVENKTVIENGALLIGVRDYKETYKKLKDILVAHNAKLESEEERTTEFRLENTFVVRLSPENFSAMAEKLRELAVVVREKRLWKQDLSTQFVDLKARLQAKYEAKRRLEQFMRSARNATEVLPIQRELDAITEEIEALTRTTRAMTQKAIYSTMTVTFYQEKLDTKPQSADFGSRMAFAAQDGWGAFKEFLVLLSFNWPYLAIGLILFTTVGLAVRSNRRQARRFRLQAMQQQQTWNLQQQQQQQQKKQTAQADLP